MQTEHHCHKPLQKNHFFVIVMCAAVLIFQHNFQSECRLSDFNLLFFSNICRGKTMQTVHITYLYYWCPQKCRCRYGIEPSV